MRALILSGLGALVACGPSLVWHGKSPDRLRELRVVEHHHRQYVVLDGSKGPSFDAIGIGALAFSPDSHHLAYAARRGKTWRMIVDGGEDPDWDGVAQVIYSKDSAHLAYAAELRGSWRFVVDGKAGPAFDALLAGSFHFAANGRFAYAAQEHDGAHVIVDGDAGPAFTGVADLVFSADGAHVAYLGHKAGLAAAVIDGSAGPLYESIDELVLAGGHSGYVASHGGKYVAVVDGVESASWDLVAGLAFSGDGAHVAYAARRAQGDTALVLDATVGTSYLGIRPATIVFPPHANQPTFVARREAGMVVVHDGTEGPVFDDVRPPAFADDRRHWGYTAVRGETWIPVLDGVPQPAERWASDPVFGPGRVGYLARRGRDIVAIVDGEPYRFDLVIDGTLAFDTSGAHWGCVAGVRAEERFYIVVDGVQRTQLDLAEAIDATMRTSAAGGVFADNDRWLREVVAAELSR